MEEVLLEEVCEAKSSNIAIKDLDNNNGEYPIYGASGFIKNVDFYKFDKPYIAIVKDGAGVGRVMLLPAKSSIIGTMQAILPKDNIDINYLYNVLSSKKLASYYSGATIPHIYFKDYKKEIVKLYELDEQKKISEKLLNVEKLISIKEKEINKMNDLVKSQFVEMFGSKQDGFKYDKVEFNKCTNNMLKGPFGSDIKKSLYVPKSTDTYKVYIQINAIQKDESLGDYYISKKYFDEKMHKFEVKPLDYIVTCDGTLGKLLRLDSKMEKGIISASLLKITLNNRINYKYFEEIWNQYMLNELSRDIRNACLTHLPSAKLIGFMTIPLPPIELQNKFAKFVEQVDKQKFIVMKTLSNVSKIRYLC